MRFLRSESYKRGVFQSIGLNIIAKALAFINSIAIAYYFGAQSKIDIYFYCYATVGLFVAFIGSLDSSVIIPEAMRIREQEGEDKEKYFLNYFFYLYSGIGVLTILMLLINPVKSLTLISNFDLVDIKNNQGLIFWFMPICLLMLITTYLTNVLASYKYFTIPIIASIINNLFSVVFLVSLHKILDVKSIVLGLSFGFVVNICILLFLMKSQLNWRFDFKKISFDQRLRNNIKYALSGNVTSFFSGYAPIFIMSNFTTGVVTMFNYAKGLSDVPNQMITAQFSAVSGIKFNLLSAKGNKDELNMLFLQSTSLLLFIMIPVCGVLFLFSNEIVTLLYHRGAFNIQTVEQTAFILKYLSFSVVYFVVNTMVSRLFMATQKLKESFWYQIYMNILYIGIILPVSFLFGIKGFLAGTLVYQSIVILFTYFLMKKYFSFINYPEILRKLVINLLLNFILVAGFSLLPMKAGNIYNAIVYAAMYFFLVFIINQGLGINKLCRQFCNQLIRKTLSFTLMKVFGAKV